jgi:hypothetical protein
MSLAWNCERRPPRSQCRQPAPWTLWDVGVVIVLVAGAVATLCGILDAVLG